MKERLRDIEGERFIYSERWQGKPYRISSEIEIDGAVLAEEMRHSKWNGISITTLVLVS